MKVRQAIFASVLVFSLAGFAAAQTPVPAYPQLLRNAPAVSVLPAVPLTPESALVAFEDKMRRQSEELAEVADITVVRAEIPSTSQKGEFELKRYYTSPRTLRYSPVSFTGDGFVKTNVITRVLQSEVDHLEKQPLGSTAISSANYKFKHKSTEPLDGVLAYVYEIKPRKKKVGLFKGRMWLEAATGNLLRAEGSAVKSPSWFIKKVEFVQDYAQVGAFTLPKHLRSVSKVRILGRAIVDIFHKDFKAVAAATPPTEAPLAGGGGR